MKIDTTQMLSAFHNVVSQVCALLAVAFEEDNHLSWLTLLLPQDVIKEAVKNFIKAHNFSHVIQDRGDSLEVYPPKKCQIISYDRACASDSVGSDWYCPSPRFNDRQFERTFHIKRNMIDMLIGNLAKFYSFWTPTIGCCGMSSFWLR